MMSARHLVGLDVNNETIGIGWAPDWPALVVDAADLSSVRRYCHWRRRLSISATMGVAVDESRCSAANLQGLRCSRGIVRRVPVSARTALYAIQQSSPRSRPAISWYEGWV